MSEQSEWYFIVEEAGERRQEGPVPTENLVDMVSSGAVTGDTLVWGEGMAEWLPACEVSEFSRHIHQEVAPQILEPEPVPEPELIAPQEVPPAEVVEEDAAGAVEPSDLVTLGDFGNHSVQFSRSRKTLLIGTNDYHAGPLELTKLDLLEFLTEMEKAAGQSE